MKNTVKVAVTGGIGSGKSAVLAIFSRLGYETISSDEIVKRLYNKRLFKKKIKKVFPFACSGLLKIKVDKKAISNAVFGDKEALEKLNSITHPLVYREIEKFFLKAKGGIAFAEIPLLFETEKQADFDKVIIVVRDKEKRIESVIGRSKLTREEICARMADQIDFDALDKSGYIVLENNLDFEDLEEKAKEVCDKLK